MADDSVKNKGMGCLVFLIFIIGLWGWISGDFYPQLTEVQEIKPDVEDAVSALTMAEHFVKENLKSPSSAKFPWCSQKLIDSIITVNSYTWIVNSYVDSQNSFGAMLRTQYRAKVMYLGDNKWKLLALDFK